MGQRDGGLVHLNLVFVFAELQLMIPKPHFQGVVLFLETANLPRQIEQRDQRQVNGVIHHFRRKRLVLVGKIEDEVLAPQAASRPHEQQETADDRQKQRGAG